MKAFAFLLHLMTSVDRNAVLIGQQLANALAVTVLMQAV
jgi:hypothetical protein